MVTQIWFLFKKSSRISGRQDHLWKSYRFSNPLKQIVCCCSLWNLWKLWRCFRKSVAQAAGVDPTSTRKLKARICAASRLLGFSILSRLIFGIQGANFCCPNFTLMLLNNWANKHCHRRLMGCFFLLFFLEWCWKWLMRCFSEGRKLHCQRHDQSLQNHTEVLFSC